MTNILGKGQERSYFEWCKITSRIWRR